MTCPATTSTDLGMSNSICRPASPSAATTMGVGNVTVTDVVWGVVLVGAAKVPANVVGVTVLIEVMTGLASTKVALL